MKKISIVMLILGSLWALAAFNFDTTVTTGRGSRVHNIGLMEERRTHLTLSSLVIVVGAILFAFSKSKQLPIHVPIEKVVVTDIRNRKYIGIRNIKLGKYQLFLTEKYAILKNETLEKYVIEDNVFDTLDDALKYADNKESEEEFLEACEKYKNAYRITCIDDNSNAYISGLNLNDIVLTYNGIPITNVKDIANAISLSTETSNQMVVLRASERIAIQVKSGPLGVSGEMVALDANACSRRVKDLKT